MNKTKINFKDRIVNLKKRILPYWKITKKAYIEVLVFFFAFFITFMLFPGVLIGRALPFKTSGDWKVFIIIATFSCCNAFTGLILA